jgi:hypothetical protein
MTNNCCRDELFEKLAEYGIEGDFNEEMRWFLDWAERHAGQSNGRLVSALTSVVDSDDVESSRFIADMALKKHKG